MPTTIFNMPFRVKIQTQSYLSHAADVSEVWQCRNKELEALLATVKAEQHKAARDADQRSHEVQRKNDEASTAAQQREEQLQEQVRQDEDKIRHQETHINELVKQLVRSCHWVYGTSGSLSGC